MLIRILFILFPVILISQTITGVTGTITTDSSVVIAGSSFGSKSNAAPYSFDDFEGGSVGANIAGNSTPVGKKTWELYDGPGDGEPIYSNSNSYGNGSQSFYHQFGGNDINSVGVDGISSSTIYFSQMMYFSWTGTPSVVKWTRITSSGAYYDSDPSMLVQNVSGANFMTVYPGAESDYFSSPYPSSTWFRNEYIIRNGTGSVYINGSEVGSLSWATGSDLDSYLMGCMAANGSATITTYYDDVYFDDTIARVEIGNSPVFNECTHREIQIPTAWSSTSISVTINQGTFETEETAYLFVVDSDGTVSSGYEIEIGGTAAGGGSSASQKKTDISSVTEDSN